MKSFDLWKKESAKRRFFFRRVRSNPQDHKNEIKTVCFVRLSLSLSLSLSPFFIWDDGDKKKDEKKDDQNKKKSKKKEEEAHFDRTKKLPKIIIVSS